MAMQGEKQSVCLYLGEGLAAYGFPDGHPFGPRRLAAFEAACRKQGLLAQVRSCQPVLATSEQLGWFHEAEYIEQVKALSQRGEGLLDEGDTPAFAGMYEAAATVVGSVLDAIAGVMEGGCRRAFVPIAGLHHARRDGAAGFCIFNDCGVAIEALRHRYGLQRIVYVDIDAHHGDGVFYAFVDDPAVHIVDLHADGRYLYPGTGDASETGRGPAEGSKLNIPLPADADDGVFLSHWPQAEAFIRKARPEFILLQCGADGLEGDPLTQLRYSEAVHATVAASLCQMADELCDGHLVALGGGGYSLENIGRAWTAVLEALLR